MADEDDFLVDVLLAVSIDGTVKKFGECESGVCFIVLGLEIGAAAAWKVNSQAWCDVDERCQ